MAQLLVRNLEDDVKAGLKARALRNRRSLEAEAREILRSAVLGAPAAELEPIGDRLVRLTRDLAGQLDVEELRFGPARVPDLPR